MNKLYFVCIIFFGFTIARCSEKSDRRKKHNASDTENHTNRDQPGNGDNSLDIEDLESGKPLPEYEHKQSSKIQKLKEMLGNKNEENTTDRDNHLLPDATNEQIDVESTFDIHQYKKLDAFLKKYVTSDGHVRYASIKANVDELAAILEEFKSTKPENSWSQNQKIAFWINAYNIYTIKLIVDNYPTTSITKIAAKPWDKKFISIGGTVYSLNDIETEILRKKYKEPRIHFALNCASESCPELLNKAYLPTSLDSQLDKQTKKFLNDSSKNSFSKKEAQISKIFDWYKEDFGGSAMDFINKYIELGYTPKNVSFKEYSWELNK